MTFPQTSRDPCINIFLESHRRWTMPFSDTDTVLEVGCSEANWGAVLRSAYPGVTLTGVDVRPCKWTEFDTLYKEDMRGLPLSAESYDWVVYISALEHVGLGHYGDPVFPDGDAVALALTYTWLKPGGSVYFDVPYTLEEGYVDGTSHRVYDEARLLWLRQHGWTEQATRCQPEPTPGGQWVYKAHWWTKHGS